MTQRKAILTCTLPVAFLIPARLSSAQATEEPGQDGFGIGIIRRQLVVPPDFAGVATGASSRAGALSEKWLWIEAESDRAVDRTKTAMLKYDVLVGKGREVLRPTP